MLAGLGLFVELQWDRFPLWVVAVAAGALAFAAMGLAIGALTREVRAASLLCVMALAAAHLPRAGAVGGGVAGAVRRDPRDLGAVSRSSPRSTRSTPRSTTRATSPARWLHLAALFLLFGAASRLALRRFA